MQNKKFKRKFWLAALAITLLSFIDYQFFARRNGGLQLMPAVRGAAGMLVMAAIAAIGCWVWIKNYAFKNVWLYAYITAMTIVAITGIGYYMLHLLPLSLLGITGFVRPFFCSPMPLFVTYLLYGMYSKYEQRGS